METDMDRRGTAVGTASDSPVPSAAVQPVVASAPPVDRSIHWIEQRMRDAFRTLRFVPALPKRRMQPMTVVDQIVNEVAPKNLQDVRLAARPSVPPGRRRDEAFEAASWLNWLPTIELQLVMCRALGLTWAQTSIHMDLCVSEKTLMRRHRAALEVIADRLKKSQK